MMDVATSLSLVPLQRLAGGFSLPRVFGFHKSFQAGQVCAPEAAISLEPGIDRTKRFGIQLVNAMASFTMLANQVRAAEQPKMLGNRGTGNQKRSCDLARRLAASAEQVENRAARGIGEGLKRSL